MILRYERKSRIDKPTFVQIENLTGLREYIKAQGEALSAELAHLLYLIQSPLAPFDPVSRG